MKTTLKLTGISLRDTYYQELCEKPVKFAWLEAQSEDYFSDGGKALFYLEKIRNDYPISLHGISLSLGSSDELNWCYLKKLKDLQHRIEPCLLSDHIAWSSIDGHYLHDLLPLPYHEECLTHVINRIQQVQDYLQQQILIENIASYINFNESTITEWEFLNTVAKQSGCGILLDVNNIYINATNFGFNSKKYLSAISADLIQEIHLGGFTSVTIGEKEVLLDTHNRLVVPAVWELYQYTIQQFGTKPTIIEWDGDYPSLETLYLEAYRAEKIMRETYAATKFAS